jgi:heme oxygenase
MQTELERPAAQTRIQRLKAMTDITHERLDKRIMAAEPFASRERYALFLHVQHHFYGDVDPIYKDVQINQMLPGLAGRARLAALKQDIFDIRGAVPAVARVEGQVPSLPMSLGWLYVAEGSNLGAAFLLKEAAKLGLSEAFGARHLAGHPDGRGLHWRNFVSAFNELPLSPADEVLIAEGAQAAFRRVHSLVDEIFR